MKILISPSKTMSKSNVMPKKRQLLFEQEKNKLLHILKSYDLKSLQQLLKVNDKLALTNFDRYAQFKEENAALFSYTGAQFKALNAHTLDNTSLNYLDEHLMIVSGLYGLLRPFDKIAFYRLPMALKLKHLTLNLYWQESISTYLEDQLIINLTSKEYDIILHNDLKILSIEFYVLKNGKLTAPSMEVKKIRGLFVRFLAKNQILHPSTMKTFDDEGYKYHSEHSTENTLVFIKQ